MEPRLDRYEHFLELEYRAGFRRSEEYSTDEITDRLRGLMAAGHFRRVVFSGMGCSAIVSDVIRSYLKSVGCPLEVHVFNDYEFDYLVPPSVVADEHTLFIISSYSGHSQEPMRVLASLEGMHHRTLLLTSGGRLAELGRELGVSIARWQLSQPDREYPLFHVGQYFSILVDMFHRLGLVTEDHRAEVERIGDDLATDFTPAHHELATLAAERSQFGNIVLIASPRWHESLLKLAKMHFNEMAMVPATRNFFHEFCHSEVASLTDPERRHSVLLFTDEDDDDYTRRKMDNLADLLGRDIPQNANVALTRVVLDQPTFVRSYFTALEFVQRVALQVGRLHETASRNLISEAAGNPWYHERTILTELAPQA